MVDTMKHFFWMGGHGFYVWSAYGSVLLYLTLQWFVARKKHEQIS